MNVFSISIGSGKMMVEFFSAEIVFNVCRYRNCNAAPDCAMTSAASLRDLDALCSPSAAITCKFTQNIVDIVPFQTNGTFHKATYNKVRMVHCIY